MKLLSSGAVLALLATSAFADNNDIFINQSGNYNSAGEAGRISQIGSTHQLALTQSGNGNVFSDNPENDILESAHVLQTGVNQVMNVVQSGNWNTVHTINQTGNVANDLSLRQTGNGNRLGGNIYEDDDDFSFYAPGAVQEGAHNEASALQSGDRNFLRLRQTGNENTMSATQSGNDNNLRLEQTFDQNDISAVQSGNENDGLIFQYGYNNMLASLQSGNGNYVRVEQGSEWVLETGVTVCSSCYANLTQSGNDNHLNIRQFGYNQTMRVVQSGSGNSVLADQQPGFY